MNYFYNLTKKELIGFALFIIFSFICKWLGIIYLIFLFIYNKKDRGLLLIIGLLLFLYSKDFIDNLFNKHNKNISEIANELNIDDYSIQEYYLKRGYKIDFIGSDGDKIYASAKKNITFPCQITERSDLFSSSSNHIKKLEENESIPRNIIEKTILINEYLSDNAQEKILFR